MLCREITIGILFLVAKSQSRALFEEKISEPIGRNSKQ